MTVSEAPPSTLISPDGVRPSSQHLFLRCFLESALGIICSADIQRLVSAFEDVAEEHEECDLPLGKLGTKFSSAKTLEAGGVEPPSEKRYGPKPTCLARSIWFAGCAWNEQETRPTSPMLSPAHHGPRRSGQPAK